MARMITHNDTCSQLKGLNLCPNYSFLWAIFSTSFHPSDPKARLLYRVYTTYLSHCLRGTAYLPILYNDLCYHEHHVSYKPIY